MNKNISVLLAALAVSPLLSGCLTTLAMKGMDGPGACPAEWVPIASSNAYAIHNASAGDPITLLPEPQQREVIPLRGGQSMVEVWYFRTGHAMCPYMPTKEPFTMVLVDPQRGSILGLGREAVGAYRPYLEHGPTHAPVDTGSSLLSDLVPFS